MSRWFAWFLTGENSVPTFRVLIAERLEVAEMMANDLAYRNKVKLIGVIIASEEFNRGER